MRVTVIGTGYVGLVTGTCLADMGNDVACQDIDAAKIEKLERGEIPIYEPGLAELVTQNLRGKRLAFTTDLATALAGTEIVFIAVGTPPAEDGSADLKHVLGCARDVARVLRGAAVVVVKSTVPIGTCDLVRDAMNEILRERNAGFTCEVVSNPEFLKEGSAIEDFMRPDRIVVGVAGEEGAAVMRKLYAPFVRNKHPLIVMDVRSSEMTKYASNVMLAARISMMNELAAICERLGADIMSVRDGVGSDQRLGMAFLYAGVGYGGSCFPKDVQALARIARGVGVTPDVLDAVERVNARQKLLVAERVMAHFGGQLKDKRIALWGLAFKPKTDDMREAPSLVIIDALTRAGATIHAYDPEAMPNARKLLGGNPRVTFASDAYGAAEGADALCLVTEWGAFRAPDFERIRASMRQPFIVDGRNQYEPQEMQRLGFTYVGVGRAVQ
ncbi:MAG TPA: UDP-glucose/GDP-mannose dehydrogenase family protein [Myxococcota bacterium]|nr:UDP-glucose/GDP-mannose dehydrogenase family protein [Myxococcota bacterium]